MKLSRLIRFTAIAFALNLCAIWLATSETFGQSVEDMFESAVQSAVEKVTPSLVRLETIGGLDRVEGRVVSQSAATGVAVSEDGFVISASFHFAHEPASIFATLPNGQKATAEIVGRDISRKIVLLKLKADFRFSVPETISRNQINVGQTVIASGRVLSADSTSVSTGIISATHRVWGRAIQTDAKVSPNNFGGPLLTLEGKVAGILVPMSPDDEGEMAGTEWYDSGIGFAVPLDEILMRMDELKSGNELKAGLIGISLKGSDVYADKAEVAFCPGSSPAAKAGIRPGDVIVAINGNPISRQSEMKHALGSLYENDIAKVVVDRDGKRESFDVKLAAVIEPYQPIGIGILAQSISDAGIAIKHVFAESNAKAANVKKGDIILKVNGKPVPSVEDLRLAIAVSDLGIPISLSVRRGDQTSEVSVEVENLVSAPIQNYEHETGDRKSDIVQIQVPDMANRCFAVIPKPSPNIPAPAVLVWVPRPGKFKQETLEKLWGQHCCEHNVVVLVPESLDPKKWSPDANALVVAAVDTLQKQHTVDANRIAVGGSNAGGTLAGLIAFGQRDMFRGLVMVDSPLSRRIRALNTSPVEPLAVLLGTTKNAKPNKEAADRLKAANFPVFVADDLDAGRSVEPWLDTIMNWLVAMDRM